MKIPHPIFLFAIFLVKGSFSQNCDQYPNNPATLIKYGVKKIIRIAETENQGKYTDAVNFIDSKGCNWKTVYRRDNKVYYFGTTKGGLEYGHKETASGYYGKDSSEIFATKKEEHYYDNSAVWKTEEWIHNLTERTAKKIVTFCGPLEPNVIDRLTYITNEKNDSLEKIVSKNDKVGSTYIRYKRENAEWKEKERYITLLDEKGQIIETRKYENGIRISGSRYSTTVLPNNLLQTTETDLNGLPIRKTVTTDSRGSYIVYDYKNGKWEEAFSEVMPYADPVNNFQPITEEITSTKKTTKDKPKIPQKIKEKDFNINPSSSTKPLKYIGKKGEEKFTWRNPEAKTDLILRELYTEEGLILEIEQPLNQIKYSYFYEFN